MLRSTLLIELMTDNKRAFYGGRKYSSLSALNKPAGTATSDGVAKKGFGNSSHPAFKNTRRWTSGELRTEPKAPTGLNKLRSPAPIKKSRRLLADIELQRTRLLIDHLEGG